MRMRVPVRRALGGHRSPRGVRRLLHDGQAGTRTGPAAGGGRPVEPLEPMGEVGRRDSRTGVANDHLAAPEFKLHRLPLVASRQPHCRPVGDGLVELRGQTVPGAGANEVEDRSCAVVGRPGG